MTPAQLQLLARHVLKVSVLHAKRHEPTHGYTSHFVECHREWQHDRDCALAFFADDQRLRYWVAAAGYDYRHVVRGLVDAGLRPGAALPRRPPVSEAVRVCRREQAKRDRRTARLLARAAAEYQAQVATKPVIGRRGHKRGRLQTVVGVAA